jgi:hypothetical protein
MLCTCSRRSRVRTLRLRLRGGASLDYGGIRFIVNRMISAELTRWYIVTSSPTDLLRTLRSPSFPGHALSVLHRPGSS